MEDFLIKAFYSKMKLVKFDAYGILDPDNKIHTLGTDSKIIGRIFEMFVQPVLEEIAKENNLILKTPKSQTIYPDFILMENEHSTQKIAIDVKTTYIDNNESTMKFTLGSYGSYMRNNTKNIEYKYTDYAKHYVIGFVYKRNDSAQESRVVDYSERSNITFPYCNVQYFIQEKHKIAGDKPGSGNTENIGSISTKNFNDFVEGNGPFSSLGSNMFNIYWKYYPKYRSINPSYTSLNEFLEWLPNHHEEISLPHNFNLDEIMDLLKVYNL